MNPQVLNLLKKNWIPATVGVAALSGGFAVGYIFGRRKILYELKQARKLLDEAILEKNSFDEFSSQRLKEAREMRDEARNFTIAAFTERPDLRPDPKDIVVDHQGVELEIKPRDTLITNIPPVTDLVTVVTGADDDWNLEAELSTRTGTEPYVLHQEEFFADEMGFTQLTWTYYKGDDILVDENDVLVYNKDEVVGELKFGHGSKDKTVVYIRNEAFQREYEVIASPGHYSVEVLGLQIEETLETEDLRHSLTILKFRQE